ncbi:SOUL family heme-binding protein [Gimesia algae]|uniref:SOUL heme-binding protein n=1 Tax=Gimesia algae TaxID=2527971 RepID=A0A517V8F7_9PLAN|nr:heme-binding protein [Gimesia algae]QDT89283.1 SOUL heme-binding protein [Gimesia algae]
MIYPAIAAVLVLLFYFGWKLTARNAYESARYTVIETDGSYQIREYPDLMLVSTDSKAQAVDRDGRFMRLFRYIDGANQQEQKVSMTTPVFMDPENKPSDRQMSFVIPQQTAAQGIPVPTGENVRIQQRKGGRFAVYRFSGRMNQATTAKAEQKLQDWMKQKGLSQTGSVESAGYDPPWTPGPLRRNEVLIRLVQPEKTNSVSE